MKVDLGLTLRIYYRLIHLHLDSGVNLQNCICIEYQYWGWRHYRNWDHL